MTDRISIPALREFSGRFDEGLLPSQVGRDEVERLIEVLPALVEAVEADNRIHVKTGFCPQCGAGPPPHHNEGCALARFDFGEAT